MSQSENPYAAPASANQTEFLKFHTAFLNSWWPFSLWSVITVPVIVWTSPELHPVAVGVSVLVITLLLSTAANFLCIKYFTVKVAPSRLRCFDAWGFSLDVGWSNIERVKTITVFPGLSYLKVFSPELKRPLWLPLFLRNREDFFKVVTKYARPDSPLIEGLRAAGFGDSEARA